MNGRKMKQFLVVLLTFCTLMTQGGMVAFATEGQMESKYVSVASQHVADASVVVSANDSYETVLINAVAAFKQAILINAQSNKTEASVTFCFSTRDSYEKMFKYLTSYHGYYTDWEPEMGLLEMALYNEAELRPYMKYGSTETHFVEVSENSSALAFTIYWPIYYNQTVENHVAMYRDDGNGGRQEFVVLEDALDAMEEWNTQYGSDCEYTVEFLDIVSSMIAPDRTELPAANNIYFQGREEYEEVSENMSQGVRYNLFVSGDLKLNSNISISQMNIETGEISSVLDGFTWDLAGHQLVNQGFADAYISIENGDMYLTKESTCEETDCQHRVFRVFGKVDVGTVQLDQGSLTLRGCYDSQIVSLENPVYTKQVAIATVYGVEGATLEIGTKDNVEISVESHIALTIGDIIEDSASCASLEMGHPQKGHYPKITGKVSDREGNEIPLRLTFDDNFYTYGFDDTFYHGIEFDKDWILLEAPNVDEVYFELEHTIYDETMCGRALVIEGCLSKNANGQCFLKSETTWTGMNQTNMMEIGKEYEASIQVYQDGVLVDDSKIISSLVASNPAHETFIIEKDGNNYTYSCDEFGYYTTVELAFEIDQEEGVTSWTFPIYAYVQEEVDSISIPTEKLTHIDGVGDVYLMVMNGKIYNDVHPGITPNVVSDAEYFVRYGSSNPDLLDAEYTTGDLYAYGHGLTEITAYSGNKSVTYTALVGIRTNYAIMYLDNVDVSNYSYWPMKEGEQVQAEVQIEKDSLEDQYGYEQMWTTSDESVVEIDEEGMLTAVNSGEALLTLEVTCLDGTVLTEEITVKVEATEEVIPDGWHQAEDGKWYYYKDGEIQKEWQYIDGKWYYLGSDGARRTNWQKIENKWYYFGTDGARKYQWQYIGKKYYYLGTDGVMRTGWQKISKEWYYFDANGAMQTGWLTLGKQKYYLKSDGAMVTGWQTINSQKYYFDANGVMKTGWLLLSGKWYYLDSNGAMQTRWKLIGGKWYYLTPENGVMKTGWLLLGKQWYYLDVNGAMQTGWEKIGSKWYYMNSNGVMQTGWLKLGNNWYFLNPSGDMVTGWKTIGGVRYYFDQNGVWIPK